MRATCTADRAGPRRSPRPTASRPRRSSRPGAARVAGRQPLHLPRLPRVRPRAAARTADRLEAVQGTGLGLLRYDRAGRGGAAERAGQRAWPAARELLIITKANSRATVHRNTYLDYISVKQFDEAGEVTGEKRFLGLFTSSAYTESVTRVPVLRDKVDAIFERTGFLPDSHSGKDLLEVLENYPRDELFQADEESLYDNATAVLHLQERRKTKLFLRRDRFGRFVSCLVYIPRDRYNTAVRLKMESILRQAFPGATRRLHDPRLRVRRWPGCTSSCASRRAESIPPSTRPSSSGSWSTPPAPGTRTSTRPPAPSTARRPRPDWRACTASAFPEAYKEDFTPRVGRRRHPAHGCPRAPRTPPGSTCTRSPARPANERRFKLYRRGPLSLTQVLPMFTTWASRSSTSGPTRSTAATASPWRLRLRPAGAQRQGVDRRGGRDRMRELFQEAVWAVWNGRAESDGFNALVLGAGLTWRQVVILRTVAKYLRQTRSTFSQDYVETALVQNLAHRGQGSWRCSRPASTPAGMPARPVPSARPPRSPSSRRSPSDLDDVKSPRPRPHHPRLPRRDPGDACARTTTSGTRTANPSRTSRSSSTPRPSPTCPRPGRVRDLRLLAPGSRASTCASVRWPAAGCAGGPAGGLPHRGARPGQGADGQERRHRAHRLQGRLLRQAAAGPAQSTATPGWPRAWRPTRSSSPACSTSPTTA